MRSDKVLVNQIQRNLLYALPTLQFLRCLQLAHFSVSIAKLLIVADHSGTDIHIYIGIIFHNYLIYTCKHSAYILTENI